MSTIQQYVKKFNRNQPSGDIPFEKKIANIKKESPFFQIKSKPSTRQNKLNVSKTKIPSKTKNIVKKPFKSTSPNELSASNLRFNPPHRGLNRNKVTSYTQRDIHNMSESPFRSTDSKGLNNYVPISQSARPNNKNINLVKPSLRHKNYYTPGKDKRNATPVYRSNNFLCKLSQGAKSALTPYSQAIPKTNKNKKCKTPVYKVRKQFMNNFELNRSYGDSLVAHRSKDRAKNVKQKFGQKVSHTTMDVKSSFQNNNSSLTSSTIKSISKQKNDTKSDVSPMVSVDETKGKGDVYPPEEINNKIKNDSSLDDDKKKTIKKRQLSIQNDFESTCYTQSKNSKNGKNLNVGKNDVNNLGIKIAPNNNSNNSNGYKFDNQSQNSNNNLTPKTDPKIVTIQKKVKNKSCFTRVGFDGQQDKEFNQDSYQIFQNFTNNPDYMFITVCDGHGDYGHLVSNYIQSQLPQKLSINLSKIDILNDTTNLNQIVQNTFVEVNKNLINNKIDTSFSGTTCCSVILTPGKLICANLGDSRAVLGRYINGHWESFDLTRDHKPSEDDEAERIIENGGIIVPLCENGQFYGPKRIWVELNEYPGLAMSRSFGDEIAETVGKICVPEMSEYILKENDKFFIVASDGVWEFFDSYDVIKAIGKFYTEKNFSECCKYIYNVSKEKWLKEEETIDDITMVIIFFE